MTGFDLLRQGFVNPNNVPEKEKNNVCVLGMDCGRLANLSELGLRQAGARAGTCRAPVFHIPPVWRKIRGVYPPLAITFFFQSCR